jgi:hypothetical protein
MLGQKEIGSWKDAEGNEQCMHGDKPAAMDTMRKLKQLGEMQGVHVALAHVDIADLHDAVLDSIMVS